MNPDILKSYLVSLGFSVQAPELQKFQMALTDAGRTVEHVTSGIASNLLKWQFAVTTAFTGFSTAVIGLSDHVAMADQQYRLFGLRMFLTQDSARKLQMTLKALGVSLEEMALDPELRARGLEFMGQMTALTGQLGKNFEANMRSIRNLHYGFSLLGVDLQFLAIAFVSSLFEKFGLTFDDLTKKLHSFQVWFVANLPRIADALANNVVPILKDTWEIVKELGIAFKQVAVLFTNLIGLFAGDQSIEGTEFSFHKLAGAIQHVVQWLTGMIVTLTHAEQMLLHFANAAVLALSGHLADAKTELTAGIKELTPGTGGIVGGVGGFAGGGLAGSIYGGVLGAAGGPLGVLIGALGGGTFGSISGGVLGTGAGAGLGALREKLMPDQGSSPSSSIADQARQLAVKTGADLGIDPRLIFEQWTHETGNFTNRGARSLNNLAGIRLGTGAYQSFASLEDFRERYEHVLSNKRYEGIKNATTPEAFAAILKRGGYYKDSYNAYVTGMRHAARSFDRVSGSGAASQTVEIGSINVHVNQPGATPDQIHQAVRSGVEDSLKRQAQLDLAQLSPGY